MAAMFRPDYLSCLLTVLSTILIGKKIWAGFVLAGINSLLLCFIGWETHQTGLVPANIFCILVYGFSIRSWIRGTGRMSGCRIPGWLRLRTCAPEGSNLRLDRPAKGLESSPSPLATGRKATSIQQRANPKSLGPQCLVRVIRSLNRSPAGRDARRTAGWEAGATKR